LTLQQRLLRFEVQRPTELFTVIREDQGGQAIHGAKRNFPQRLPLYSSGINLAPIFALIHFQSDPRFSRSVVKATDGSTGLQFTEGVAPGFKEPLFAGAKSIVTFWLDSAYQIQSATYADSQNLLKLVIYKYSYASVLTTPFVQPQKVDCLQGSLNIWSTAIAAATVNVSVPSDFFQISR
jgi:hypothetical protein